MNIRLSSYDRNDLIRILDYAIEKKKEDFLKGKISKERSRLDIDIIVSLRDKMPCGYIKKN